MEPRRSTQISTRLGGPDLAYAERRERKKGVRYRGIYKAADGRYRSAGTFSTEERALAVAEEAERHAAELVDGAAGGLDPATRATRTIAEYAPLFLRHHQVEGNTKALSEHDPASQGRTRRDVRHGRGGQVPGLQPVP